MTDTETLAFIRSVLFLTRKHDIEDDLRWLVEENGDIKFYVICSDTFAWGCADAEDITPENLPVFEQVCNECEALDANGADDIDHKFAILYAAQLFAARVRGMRPQGACYKSYPKRMWHLFNACGPERLLNLINPKPIPEI